MNSSHPWYFWIWFRSWLKYIHIDVWVNNVDKHIIVCCGVAFINEWVHCKVTLLGLWFIGFCSWRWRWDYIIKQHGSAHVPCPKSSMVVVVVLRLRHNSEYGSFIVITYTCMSWILWFRNKMYKKWVLCSWWQVVHEFCPILTIVEEDRVLDKRPLTWGTNIFWCLCCFYNQSCIVIVASCVIILIIKLIDCIHISTFRYMLHNSKIEVISFLDKS